MQVFRLEEFVDDIEEVADAGLLLHAGNLIAPGTVENLRRLRRLGLLTDDVILAIIGQAPIDPFGVYGAMKDMGVWAFQQNDLMMVQILAKKGNQPVALMRLDLLSDNLDFVVLREGQLVLQEQVLGETIADRLREPGMTSERLMSWLVGKMKAVIAEGKAA
jgi:hypothetical protein